MEEVLRCRREGFCWMKVDEVQRKHHMKKKKREKKLAFVDENRF